MIYWEFGLVIVLIIITDRYFEQKLRDVDIIQSMKKWNLSLNMITVQKGAQLIYDLSTLNIAMYCFRIFDDNHDIEMQQSCESYYGLHNACISFHWYQAKATEQIYEQV